jgi:class 3 adenylate cyclase
MGRCDTEQERDIIMAAIQALVAFSDLTGYAKVAAQLSDEEVFRFLSDYYEFVGDAVSPAGGQVIKFMGDGALVLFPEANADAGVRALLAFQEAGDRFVSGRGFTCRHQIRVHFGLVQEGLLGTRGDKRTDIIGSAVNAMFLLKRSDFAITPEAFRRLKPETRTLFKKHTPPVTYIPVHHLHRDG